MLPRLPWPIRRWCRCRRLGGCHADRARHQGPAGRILHPGRRATRAWLLAGLVLGLVLLNGCGTGDGGESATAPHRTIRHRPPRARTRVAERDGDGAHATDPTRAETPTTRTPTLVPKPCHQPRPPRRWHAGLPPSPKGMGALGWVLLIVLVVGLVAGWMILRSRRKSAMGRQSRRAGAGHPHHHQHPAAAVRTAGTTGQRALLWPPLRAALVTIMRRWDLLARTHPTPATAPVRTDRPPAPGAAGGIGRRERGAGDRAGLAAPAATGGRGRAGAVGRAGRRPPTEPAAGRGWLDSLSFGTLT
jgi:hypothetical protein